MSDGLPGYDEWKLSSGEDTDSEARLDEMCDEAYAECYTALAKVASNWGVPDKVRKEMAETFAAEMLAWVTRP